MRCTSQILDEKFYTVSMHIPKPYTPPPQRGSHFTHLLLALVHLTVTPVFRLVYPHWCNLFSTQLLWKGKPKRSNTQEKSCLSLSLPWLLCNHRLNQSSLKWLHARWKDTLLLVTREQHLHQQPSKRDTRSSCKQCENYKRSQWEEG